MWYDIFTGEIHYFSKKQKHFVPIKDETVDILVNELQDSEMDHAEFVKSAQNVFPSTTDKKCC